MECSRLSTSSGSSVHGDSPGKNTEVCCRALLQGISPTQGETQVSRISGGFFPIWAPREAHVYKYYDLNHPEWTGDVS